MQHIFISHQYRVACNGNSLCNACSLAVTGEEKLCHLLRALTSAELYLHSNFYASHPHFLNLLANEETSYILKSMFSCSVSHDVDKLSNISENYSDSIKIEALKKCQDRRQSPFICVMALSSVLGLQVNSFSQSLAEKRLTGHSSNLKNAVLQPREVPGSLNAPINLMFSREGCLSTVLNSCYKSNHFVPLFVMPGQGSPVNAINAPKPTQKSFLSFLRKLATDHQLARKESEPPTKCKETSSSTLIPDDSSASDLLRLLLTPMKVYMI